MSGYVRAYSENLRYATSNLDDDNLRLYIALLSYGNCQAKCWPGIKALVNDTGMVTNRVYAALEALVAHGLVEIVRRGTRDAETGMQLPNVYKINGVVIDNDDCIKTEQTFEPILEPSSNEESKHHQRTDSLNTTKETQPETPPPTQPTPSKMASPKPKTNAKTEKTPTRSVNTNSPDSVPRKFYSGPLAEFAGPLAADDEQIVADLRAIDARMTIRTARYLVASRGAARALWAIGHYRKQSNVFNPAGYIRSLIEREAVEQVDSEPIDPGLAYISGAYADYIDH